MTKEIYTKKIFASFLLMAAISFQLRAQDADTAKPVFKPHGNIWGLTFGDYVFKGNADTVGSGQGRGSNQYSKVPVDSRYFQFRRVYLGYNYDMSPKFSVEILLAAENDLAPGSIGNQNTNGDVLTDGKFAPFLKLADLRWKNIFKGTDLVMGQMTTPSFPLLSENIWGYRSVERTIADMLGTPSYDEGIALQGHFDPKANFGYNLMVGTGNSAKPATNNFQMFYGDIWAKFFDQKLVIDLYQDYEKLNWTAIDTSNANGYHHDRNTTKLLIAWTVPKFTVGIEALQTTMLGDVAANTLSNRTFYYTTFATDVSLYVRGRLYKDKLGFFARYDNYDPGHKISEITDNPRIVSYTALTSAYDPTTKQQFVTFGIDYTPFENVHLMPNFYMNTYACTLPSADYNLNPKGSGVLGTDAVYRLTIYYIFGKKDPVRY